MKVLDIQGNIIAQYKNIPFTNFSPDGTKFLYRPLDKNRFEFWYSPPCIFDKLTDQTRCYNDLLTKHHVENGHVEFFNPQWLKDQRYFSYNYYTYDLDTHDSGGGLCFVEIESGSERCILDNFKNDFHEIISYKFSPNEKTISFVVNIAPNSDDWTMAQFGIANAHTGEYMLYPEFSLHEGIWRP
jgi:hypothetical protein